MDEGSRERGGPPLTTGAPRRANRAVLRPRRRGAGPALAAGLIVLAAVAILGGYVLGRLAMEAFLARRDGEPPASPPGVTTPAPGVDDGGSPPPADQPQPQPEPQPEPPADQTNPPAPPDGAQVVTRTLAPPAFTLYRVQVGAFAAPQNAAALVEDLIGRGFAACACPGGPPYRVAGAAATDRAAASYFAGPLISADYEVYVRDWAFNPAPLQVAGPAGYLDFLGGNGSVGGASGGALADMTAFAARCGDAWSMWGRGERAAFATACPDVEARARALNLALGGCTPPAQFQAAHATLVAAAAAAVRAANEMQALAQRGDAANLRAGMHYYLEFLAGYEAAYLKLRG